MHDGLIDAIRFLTRLAVFASTVMLLACNQGSKEAGSKVVVSEKVIEVPDFSAIQDIKLKKTAFFDFMRPIIRSENSKVAFTRERMLEISAQIDNGNAVSREDQEWLFRVANDYRIEMVSIEDEQAWEQLKRRVDTVPFRLALVQAANESSWGTSRFARESRNFFGEWCFTRDCGVVPIQRREGDTHEVKVFESVNDSVASYLRNLNRVDMYLSLRIARQDIRKQGESPTAHELASGLAGYSARGDEYVEEIQDMIRTNYDLMGVPDPQVTEDEKIYNVFCSASFLKFKFC